MIEQLSIFSIASIAANMRRRETWSTRMYEYVYRIVILNKRFYYCIKIYFGKPRGEKLALSLSYNQLIWSCVR
jgi:hypothetical protein